MEKTIKITGEDIKISDGYHTFDELYEHRIMLWIALCRAIQKDPQYQYRTVWRSKLHSDGTSFDGWYILGMTTEDDKQLSYHLPNITWLLTDFAQTLDKAPEWDGHTSNDVLERLKTLWPN